MNFAVLDFETTGNTAQDEIIQIGLVRIEDGIIVKSYASLIQPGIAVPAFITELTGITQEELWEAPTLEETIADWLPLLADCSLVAHNAPFDLGFLQRALDQCGYAYFDGRVLDLMDLLRMCYPYLASYQLSQVTQAFDIKHERPHQADSDAEATAELWLQCLNKLLELPLITIQRIASLYEQANDDLGWLLEELSNQRQLTIAEEELTSSRFYRQFALQVEDWRDETSSREKEEEQLLPETFEALNTMLEQRLRENFTRYESRASQVQMMNEVHESLDAGRHLLIEAGTGTGKSLGYLIPALYYGISTEQKVIVSTHTINLQEQLRERDIPLLQRIFPVPFRAAVLKGRSHYLCLRKFEQRMQQFAYEPSGKEERLTAAQMLVWLGETKQGDVEEIHLRQQGLTMWQTVASDTDSCLNRACPWFRKCFYHRAKHEATLADVIITNHSMVLTDVKAEHRLLPGYQHLIIDEAHHFEEVAEKHLGLNLTYYGLAGRLNVLSKERGNGMLYAFQQHLATVGSELSIKWSEDLDLVHEHAQTVRETWEQLSDTLYQILQLSAGTGASVDRGPIVARLQQENKPDRWEELLVMEDNIQISLNKIVKPLDQALNELKEEEDDLGFQSFLTDLGGISKDLARCRDALRTLMRMEQKELVYWLEASAHFKSKSLEFHAVPLDVSPLLRHYFFEPKSSVVMTSATLTVNKKFDYSLDQFGLRFEQDPDKVRTVMLPSPFNYRMQSLVCIPRDFPKISGQSGEEAFILKLVESLEEIALAMRGKMLVLFTSYRMLRQTHDLLKPKLNAQGIEVLGHGIDSGGRSKLTRRFQQSQASVLLGTSSFWEGVDIPGEALSCLAIVRLPFMPPNHPLTEAKAEMLKQRKMNPFMKLSVPQAVIRFKQGFGRLVRTRSDQGIVVIYDTRVIETQYGKEFLYSLPGPKIEHMPQKQLVPRMMEWLNQAKTQAQAQQEGEMDHAGQ